MVTKHYDSDISWAVWRKDHYCQLICVHTTTWYYMYINIPCLVISLELSHRSLITDSSLLAWLICSLRSSIQLLTSLNWSSHNSADSTASFWESNTSYKCNRKSRSIWVRENVCDEMIHMSCRIIETTNKHHSREHYVHYPEWRNWPRPPIPKPRLNQLVMTILSYKRAC